MGCLFPPRRQREKKVLEATVHRGPGGHTLGVLVGVGDDLRGGPVAVRRRELEADVASPDRQLAPAEGARPPLGRVGRTERATEGP